MNKCNTDSVRQHDDRDDSAVRIFVVFVVKLCDKADVDRYFGVLVGLIKKNQMLFKSKAKWKNQLTVSVVLALQRPI